MRPLLLLLLISATHADPLVIRSGASSEKDEGRRQDANVFDLNTAKGVSNYEGEEGFNRDNESKHVQAQDAGKYNEENSQKKLHADEGNFADSKFHQAEGGEAADVSKKSANKKGHHNSGYTKSFRKDESASTSSFYDDADDEGHEVLQNNKKNAYGDVGQNSQRGSHLDDRRYSQDQGKNGYYNNAGNYEKDMANQKGYHGKKYYDARENEGRRNMADRYDEGGRYGEEKFVNKGGPHYYEEPYYRPKKTITIYEDPRYDGQDQYPAYDSDYVQLEVKRAPRDYDYNRYYNRKPSYDYYY